MRSEEGISLHLFFGWPSGLECSLPVAAAVLVGLRSSAPVFDLVGPRSSATEAEVFPEVPLRRCRCRVLGCGVRSLHSLASLVFCLRQKPTHSVSARYRLAANSARHISFSRMCLAEPDCLLLSSLGNGPGLARGLIS